jgi:hypothetical protein
MLWHAEELHTDPFGAPPASNSRKSLPRFVPGSRAIVSSLGPQQLRRSPSWVQTRSPHDATESMPTENVGPSRQTHTLICNDVDCTEERLITRRDAGHWSNTLTGPREDSRLPLSGQMLTSLRLLRAHSS